MADTEELLLGSEFVDTVNKLNQQTIQMGSGFYQLARSTNFEEKYPNAIDDFLQSDAVKTIASDAGISAAGLKPPIDIPDETITRIDNFLASADPLTMSDTDLAKLQSDIKDIINDITIPTTDELLAFINNFTKFVSAASIEDVSFSANTREIRLVSTDTSLDNFIARVGVGKLTIIAINKLLYPYITERFHIPSILQATVIGSSSLAGESSIIYTGITKQVGATGVKAGGKILITNNARDLNNLEQQKTEILWISEDLKTIQLKDALLFDISPNHVVQIYQYIDGYVLSPGEFIKIPK